MAVSMDNKYAANAKMIMLMNMMISPMLVPSFLLTKMASTSVPSITEPPRMANPIPAPKKNPPKIEISNLSLVI